MLVPVLYIIGTAINRNSYIPLILGGLIIYHVLRISADMVTLPGRCDDLLFRQISFLVEHRV